MRRLLSARWRRHDEGSLVRGTVVEEIRDVVELETTVGDSGKTTRWRALSNADSEPPVEPTSPLYGDLSVARLSSKSYPHEREGDDGGSMVAIPLNTATADDLRPFLRLSRAMRCLILLEHLTFWLATILIVPILADAELTCGGGLTWLAHLIFGAFCCVITATELVLMGHSERGQKLLCKKGRTACLACLGIICRFDLYSDVVVTMLTLKCASEVWKAALTIVLVGVVAFQVLPGIFLMFRFVACQEHSFEACVAGDLHALIETLDPTGTEASLQPAWWPQPRQAAAGVSLVAPAAGGADYEALAPAEQIGEGDRDALERRGQLHRDRARAEAEAELAAAAGAGNAGRLAAAVERATACGCEGRPLRSARAKLDVEARLQCAAGSLRRARTILRLLSEDLWLAVLQVYFMYRTWGGLSLENRCLAVASVAAAVLAPLGCCLCAWASANAGRAYLCTRASSELEVAISTRDARQIHTCLRGIAQIVPEGDLLHQRIELALLELPTAGADHDKLKTADLLSRFTSVLRGEGRALSLAALRQKWAEAQGVYHLLDAIPAGLLCIIRLEDDVVRGEVVIEGQRCSESVEFFTVRLLEPTFEGSDAHEAFECAGLRVENVSLTSSEHPPDVCIELPEGKELFPEVHAFHGLIDPCSYSQFLTIKLGQDFESYDVRPLWDMSSENRNMGGLPTGSVPIMIRALVSIIPDRSLTLGLLRSPSPSRLQDPRTLHIKPGFYAGDFGDADYGNFSREVCLVDYSQIDLDSKSYSEGSLKLSRLFRDDVPYPFSKLRQCLPEGSSITVATCTKATGDIHVPMGQTAWVALVEPPCQALGLPELPPLPEGLHDKEGGRLEVLEAWPGAGTLAGAGFREARWDFGWLLRLAGGRLAFAWQGDLEVIALAWARAQDAAQYAEPEREDWSSIF